MTSILHNFLELEKDLNKDLLELHKCAGINTYGEVLSVEKQCRNNLMRKRVLYDQLGFTEIVDPEVNFFFHKMSYYQVNFPSFLISSDRQLFGCQLFIGESESS